MRQFGPLSAVGVGDLRRLAPSARGPVNVALGVPVNGLKSPVKQQRKITAERNLAACPKTINFCEGRSRPLRIGSMWKRGNVANEH